MVIEPSKAALGGGLDESELTFSLDEVRGGGDGGFGGDWAVARSTLGVG